MKVAYRTLLLLLLFFAFPISTVHLPITEHSRLTLVFVIFFLVGMGGFAFFSLVRGAYDAPVLRVMHGVMVILASISLLFLFPFPSMFGSPLWADIVAVVTGFLAGIVIVDTVRAAHEAAGG